MPGSRLVILGAGGHGRELLDIVEAVNELEPRYDFVGFCDDGLGPWPRLQARHARVVGTFAELEDLDAGFVIGLGRGIDRQAVDHRTTAMGCTPVSLAHPLASRGSDLDLGPGLVMAAGARITTNVAVGRHVHLNVNATLSHDCRVGNYVTLNPGAHVNGNVTLGDRVVVGSGAVIREGSRVGADVVIGAGAVVVDDISPGLTVVGVPARPLDRPLHD